MTNVTYLPWVDPDKAVDPENSPVDPAPAGAGSSVLFSEKLGLAPEVGLDVDAADVDQQDEPTGLDLEALEQSLLRKLNSTDMSVHEVHTWLRERDAAEGDAANIIDKFERLGYLDDDRLAAALTQKLSERKGKSRGAIAGELRQRGVRSSSIDLALGNIADDEEAAKAIELACVRVRQFRALDDETAQRRLFGFLSRRGYSGAVVRDAVRAAMSHRHDEGDASARQAPRQTPRFH